MKIGERIKMRRIELGWSLQDLADRMGYANKSSVARIESGKIDPPQSKVVKFAQVLDTDVSDLMGWGEKKETPEEDSEVSENQRLLMEFAKSVPEEKAGMILQVMKTILGDEK